MFLQFYIYFLKAPQTQETEEEEEVKPVAKLPEAKDSSATVTNVTTPEDVTEVKKQNYGSPQYWDDRYEKFQDKTEEWYLQLEFFQNAFFFLAGHKKKLLPAFSLFIFHLAAELVSKLKHPFFLTKLLKT